METRTEALLAKMKEKGISTDKWKIKYTETTVGYPGGSYMNRLFEIDFGNGNRENFDARLVEAGDYYVFLGEVKRYL